MKPHSRAGFTLIELLVTLALLAVVAGAVVAVVLTVQRGYIRQREIVRAEDALRAAETMLLTALRTAGANPYRMTGASAPQLVSNPLAHASNDNVRVVADYNPANGSTADPLEDIAFWVASDTLFVRWQTGGTAAPAAYPVRSIVFEYYLRDGTLATTSTQIAAANRVKFVLTAPSHDRPSVLTRRERWVYLRNR